MYTAGCNDFRFLASLGMTKKKPLGMTQEKLLGVARNGYKAVFCCSFDDRMIIEMPNTYLCQPIRREGTT